VVDDELQVREELRRRDHVGRTVVAEVEALQGQALVPAHDAAAEIAEELLALAYDPQTSGGLLISLPADKGAVLIATFAEHGLSLERIGRVVEGAGVSLA